MDLAGEAIQTRHFGPASVAGEGQVSPGAVLCEWRWLILRSSAGAPPDLTAANWARQSSNWPHAKWRGMHPLWRELLAPRFAEASIHARIPVANGQDHNRIKSACESRSALVSRATRYHPQPEHGSARIP